MFGKGNGAKFLRGLVLILCLTVFFGVTALAAADGWKELQDAAGGAAQSAAWDPYFTVSVDTGTGERMITLKQDIVCTDQTLGYISIGSMPIIIDLNDHAINRNLKTATGSGNVIWIPKGASLTIRDTGTSGKGKITGGKNTTTWNQTAPGCSGGIFVYGGTLKLEGGTVCNNETTTKTGAGIYLNGGTLEMSGNATVSGNTASSYAGGVEVFGGASMIMKDNSKITGNKAKYGGGIDVDGSSTLTMQDNALITDNEAGTSGGGIFLEGSGTVTLTGNASITGNKAGTAGGGIMYIGKSKLVVGGSAEVSGNTMSGAANNVSILTNKVITVGTGSNAPTGAMLIGVITDTKPTASSPVAVTGANSADYSSCFTSDITAYKAVNVSNTVKLMPACTVTNATPETDKTANHGYVTVDMSTAVTGETVTVTVFPNDGYELDTLVYTDSSDHDITSAKSFTMPSTNVTVKATFKQATVAKPAASPEAGTYTGIKTVTLSTATAGADIYYTTDGTTPTADSTKYTGAITVAEDTVIKAVAIKAGWKDSEVLEAAYTIIIPVAKVEVDPAVLNLKPGETGTVTVTVLPENAADKTLTLSMDQDGIVTVAADGTVTALKTGTVIVTWTAGNGVSGSCVVIVKDDPIEYKIIIGAEQTIITNAEKAVFASNADFSKFAYVKVDDEVVSSDYFTAKSGSTVITFNNTFISDKLAVGRHTIEIVSVDGSAKANFLVADLPPRTGDSFTPTLWLGICMLSILGIVVIQRRKAHLSGCR